MKSALEFDGIGKNYKGFSLEPTSFALPRGYIMGLIGPNGAGKTTLIKLVLDLVRGDTGSIRVFGKDHVEEGKAIRARIGYVPDEPKFHEDIALKHLKQATAPFYPGWDEKRFATLADAFELPLGRKFKKLSQGMKTKFALALSLSQGAELLILDEPTSGLDPAFRRELLRMLGDLLQDDRVSVLFSTHITADLERTADFITFLQDGHIVFSKPKDEVLDTYVVVRGGRDLIDPQTRSLFDGVRLRAHDFEGLTSRVEEVRSRFGNQVAFDRASLDDVMVLMRKEKELNHAA
jgi:ABC-2 type transport system ATP-binding protein